MTYILLCTVLIYMSIYVRHYQHLHEFHENRMKALNSFNQLYMAFVTLLYIYVSMYVYMYRTACSISLGDTKW